MKNYIQCISITFPIFCGYIPLAMVFGFLLTSQGVDWYMAPLFSLLVFAGAMQFLAIPMLVASASYLDFAIAALLVNFRHVFYGISLMQFLPKNPCKRAYFIFCITDENYSLLTGSANVTRDNALFIVMLNHGYWIVGSLLGATVAQGLPQVDGLDFSLTALFTVLFVEQFFKNRDYRLLLIGFAACVIAISVFPQQFLIMASVIALGLLYLDFRYYRPEKENNDE